MKKRINKFIIIIIICLFGINFSTHSFNNEIDLIPSVSAQSLLDTFVSIILVCGDGYTDTGLEFCDPGNPAENIPPDVGSSTCQDFIDPVSAAPFLSGDLNCTNDCSAYATTTCYTCGNNYMKAPMEECDGTDFGGSANCTDYGYTGGDLSCTYDCRLDLSQCYISGTEQPEDGDSNSSGGSSGGSVGFSPGQEQVVRETGVTINGKSYPHSEVRILIDGKVVGIVKADSKADFDFEIDDVTPGITTFGLWSEDEKGLKSTLLSLTFRVASKSVTTISNVYISPTIDIDKRKVEKGGDITIIGKASPQVDLNVHINSPKEFIEKTISDEKGDWKLVFNTKELEEDFHTVKAVIRLEATNGIIESNFSRTLSFYVGDKIPEENCGMGDLNCDGSVNLIDFSILLFNWETNASNADVNHDNNVGLADFSIMMFYWTG